MNTTVVLPETHRSKEEWNHLQLNSCTLCLENNSEHFDELLKCLANKTGVPNKDLIYKQIVKIINEKLGDDEQQAKDIRRQVRNLINKQLIETAQHVCLSRKKKPALQPIADELSILPSLFSLSIETRIASFNQLERFADSYGPVGLNEHGRQAIQSFERNSSAMLRGRNLYSGENQDKTTFEICLQIERFHSSIGIGICSDNASPDDIEEASNTFPIDPTRTSREGDIFHLLIDINEYTIYLWNSYLSKKHQNMEPKKRERKISRRKCPLPWRYFVILRGNDNHVRIVY